MIIAIDGPAGSGKSTTARRVAEKLGFLYLDTGAMYRALTLFAQRLNLNLQNEEALTEVAKRTKIYFKEGRIFLNGEDVTEKIRHPRIDKDISCIARVYGVRREMVRLQRKIAQNSSCVAEGRDTTTVVFPQADLKIFLDADIGERALRRLKDFKEKKINIDIARIRKDLEERDRADRTREISPLLKTEDAVYIDTTHMSISEVVDRIYKLAQEKLSQVKS